jgi:hypothetical protein
MSAPSTEFLAGVLADAGLALAEARLSEAAASHARFREGLEQLRATELSFFEPVVEPATAFQWLEAEGRSVR